MANKSDILGGILGGAAILGLVGVAGAVSYQDAKEGETFRAQHKASVGNMLGRAGAHASKMGCCEEALQLLNDAAKTYDRAGGSTIEKAYSDLTKIVNLIVSENEAQILRMHYEKKLAEMEVKKIVEDSRTPSTDSVVGITFSTTYDAEQYLRDLGYKEYGRTFIKGDSSVRVERKNCQSIIVSAR